MTLLHQIVLPGMYSSATIRENYQAIAPRLASQSTISHLENAS
jgi:hypothetical protein